VVVVLRLFGDRTLRVVGWNLRATINSDWGA
jgi:hypothetical protein